MNVVSVCAAAGIIGVGVCSALGDPAETVLPFEEHAALASLPERLEEAMDTFHGSGVAAVVIDGGKVYGWFGGHRDPVERLPADADTMFYIASVTKTYTAACVNALADDGVIDLDRGIESYLPRFEPATNEHEGPIPVRKLLTHEAGISVPGLGILDAYTGDITEDRFYTLLSTFGEAVPGPSYDNENLTTAGRVIDAATGESWKGVMDRRLFDRVGMTRTTAYASEAFADGNVAVPAYWDDERRRHGYAPRKFDEVMHAAGGIMTSGRDAARWMLFSMGDGTWEGNRVLSERHARDAVTLQAKLRSPVTDGPFEVNGYGHAWEIGEHGGQRIAFHSGGYMGGFAAFFILFPESGKGLAVMGSGMELAAGVPALAMEACVEALSGVPVAQSDYERGVQMVEQGGLADTRYRPRSPRIRELRCAPDCFGVFEHELWGTITVKPERGRVSVSFGKLPLQTSVDQGDLRVEGPVGRGAHLRYDAEEDAYFSQFAPGEPEAFRRVGG
ncbi:MAG: serine hydrolase domain-containing protein [Phycisphaerales bacterium]